VNMVEYYIVMYENGKKTCWKYSKKGEGGTKENDGGVNLIKIHCKYFFHCHNVPQEQQ
jgi:hypothetical protein